MLTKFLRLKIEFRGVLWLTYALAMLVLICSRGEYEVLPFWALFVF